MPSWHVTVYTMSMLDCSIESANELQIEHRVWHRSVVSGRVGGA